MTVGLQMTRLVDK